MSPTHQEQLDRATGALWGLAIGDALGMPTQLMSRRQVADTYGVIDGFRAASAEHPIAAGLFAGTVTDDTEQALLLAKTLGTGAHLDQRAWADALLGWESATQARGSLDLLGPSSRAALAALRSGVSLDDAGRLGTTNGAAMRICPVGIAVDTSDPTRLLNRVVDASRLTHNTSVALSGAAAVAGAVSRCVEGADLDDAVAFAVQMADLAAAEGHWVAGASVARRIEWAVAAVSNLTPEAVSNFVTDLVGTSLATQESVPAAFAVVAACRDDPWGGVLAAAGLGGDSDTIGAMAGAILGARHGVDGFPPRAVRLVAEVNSVEMRTVARALLDLRWA